MKLNPKEIVIGERQRIDLGDPLTDLASMGDSDVGQINPIRVELRDGKHYLIAGRRRLEYALRNNWEEIEAYEVSNLTEIQRQKIELFEDIERKDRSWQEVCIAWCKLNRMMQYEHEGWNERAMAKFTKMPRSNVHYVIALGKLLSAEPRDEELWSAPGYVAAVAMIVDRNSKAAQAELERRRLAAARAIVAPTPVESPSLAQVLSKTEEKPSEAHALAALTADALQDWENDQVLPVTEMPIFGYNIDFSQAVPGKHFIPDCFSAALLFNAPEKVKLNLDRAMTPTGFIVSWFDGGPSWSSWICSQTLIWNKVHAIGPSAWPFVFNYAQGFCMTKEAPKPNDEPKGSVISVVKSDDELPRQVVAFSLDAICGPDTLVLCPCNAPVLAVVESGRIPVFFEADPVLFAKKVDELVRYYNENIPNVEVKLVEQPE